MPAIGYTPGGWESHAHAGPASVLPAADQIVEVKSRVWGRMLQSCGAGRCSGRPWPFEVGAVRSSHHNHDDGGFHQKSTPACIGLHSAQPQTAAKSRGSTCTAASCRRLPHLPTKVAAVRSSQHLHDNGGFHPKTTPACIGLHTAQPQTAA
jgi:hypothetical protein